MQAIDASDEWWDFELIPASTVGFAEVKVTATAHPNADINARYFFNGVEIGTDLVPRQDKVGYFVLPFRFHSCDNQLSEGVVVVYEIRGVCGSSYAIREKRITCASR
jgi:hypothetical protein